MRMKNPLYPLTWVTAHLHSNQKSSSHKMEPQPTRAGNSWKNVYSYCSLGKETLTIYNYRIWGKNAFPLNIPSSTTQPDLKLTNITVRHQHQYSCRSFTGFYTPTEVGEAGKRVEGCEGPPTCQVPFQSGRGSLVPCVAAEEEEPDQEGGQHQNQDPEEPGHRWVSDSPGCQDIHAEGW